MSLKVALLLAVQGVEDPNGQNWNDDENFMQCDFFNGTRWQSIRLSVILPYTPTSF